MFGFWPTKSYRQRESDQLGKINAGREAMRDAVTSTTQIADGFASWLKQGFNPDRDDALLLCESDGRITSCNHAAQTMFKTDGAHHSIKEFLYPDGDPLDKVWAAILAASPDAKNYMLGIRDGLSFPAEVSVYQLDRGPGQPPKILMMVRDLIADTDDTADGIDGDSVRSALRMIRQHKIAHAVAS